MSADVEGGQRLVVGIDGSEPSERALEWAVDQAARTGAHLELHAAFDPGCSFVAPDEIEKELQARIEQGTAAVHERAPGVVVSGVTHQQAPAAALIDASRGAELLVVGSRGRGGFAGMLLGSVSLHCSLHAHCPVVIVRPPEA
jgi:nucleotide-binding universal stress UspA family protein